MKKNQTDTEKTISSAGAPEGNNNAGKGAVLSGLLRQVLNADNRKQMKNGVQKIADAFEEGERWAVEFVFDRLEGKAIAKTELTGAEGSAIPLSIGIKFVGTDGSTVSE